MEDSCVEKCELTYKSYNRIKLVPLCGIRCLASIRDMIADVLVEQRFINLQTISVEASFLFRQKSAAIYSFEVNRCGKTFIGVCKGKHEAFDTYDHAIASGYLVERSDTADTFNISVGNLPPHQECIIRIRYLYTLGTEGEALKFTLPMTRVPLAEETLNPTADNATLPHGVDIHLDIDMSSEIVGLQCQSHHIAEGPVDEDVLKVQKNRRQLQVVNVTESKAFVLLIGVKDSHKPFAMMEMPVHSSKQQLQQQSEKEVADSSVVHEYEKSRVIMASFFPKVETENDSLCEIIFLVDRSGSMYGSNMQQAKNALQLFLRSLPLGNLFNIVGFGTGAIKLFPNSTPLDSESLTIASDHIAKMNADLGGTELLRPLQDILRDQPNENFPRQVMILTDGQVDFPGAVLDLVREASQQTRVFSFGIGQAASRFLVEGIAQYGHGVAEFVQDGERIESKVLQSLKLALQPILRNVTIEWTGVRIKRQAPQKIPPIFNGEKVVVFAFVEDEGAEHNSSSWDNARATIKGFTTKEESFSFPFQIDFSKPAVEGNLLHRLATNALIRDLEMETDEDITMKTIVPLAVQYGFVTKYTSIVAVEQRSESTPETMIPASRGTHIGADDIGLALNSASFVNWQDQDATLDSLSSAVARLKELANTITSELDDHDKILADLNREVDSGVLHKATSMVSNMLDSMKDFFSSLPLSLSQWSSFNNSNSASQPSMQSSSSNSLFGNDDTNNVAVGGKAEEMDKTPVSLAHEAELKWDQLLMMQQADGSWLLDERLLAIVKLRCSVEENCKKAGLDGNNGAVRLLFATALATISIQKLYQSRKEHWDLLVAKALKFLKREAQKTNYTEDAFVIAAMDAVDWDAVQNYALN